MAIADSRGVKEALERIQLVYQTWLAADAVTLGIVGGTPPLAGDYLPANADIQIGPHYTWTGDPVFGIEWDSTETEVYISPRRLQRLLIITRLLYFAPSSVEWASVITPQYERLMTYTLENHFRAGVADEVLSMVEIQRSRAVEARKGDQRGHGVELEWLVDTWRTHPNN